MKFFLHESERESRGALRRTLERELPEKLSRLSSRLRTVAVSIRDLNGPRGGVDKEIRIVARLVTGQVVVVGHRTSDVLWDLPSTIRRLVNAVRSKLSRRRYVRRALNRSDNESFGIT